MDRFTRREASIDNVSLKDLRNYRVRSRFFNLTFPQNGVYDVAAGITRSVCDGYWIFLKSLSREKHYLHFAGECVLPSGEVVTENIKKDSIYLPFRQFIENNQKFKGEVIYDP
jgi:hypothetical protein